LAAYYVLVAILSCSDVNDVSLFFYFYVGFDEGLFALSVGLIIEALIS